MYALGVQSGQMALHIGLMNVAAPLLSAALGSKLSGRLGRPQALWLSAGAQLILLWGWHLPFLQQAAMASHALHLLMQATLFAAAILFWSAIIAVPRRRGGRRSRRCC